VDDNIAIRGADLMNARGFALSAALLLGACGSGRPPPAPTPTPTPTPSATVAAYNVENCFTQVIPGTGGQTMRSLIVPDTLKLDLARPAGFPNGRDLDDPVIDILLAMLFLDFGVTGQSPMTFANLPLNPPRNDRPFTATFPFLAPPQGTPPLAATTGTSFDFRTDPDTAYVGVDRMGQPAIATALIGSSQKNPYNDANPTVDASGQFRTEQTNLLTGLYRNIADDLTNLGLRLCGRPA
jgi:hypothetical protein